MPQGTERRPGKPLTDDEHAEIVRLRLDNVPVRDVAEQIGTTTGTVQHWWRNYLHETGQARRREMEGWQSELVARLLHIATRAQREAEAARLEGDRMACRAFMAEERQALRECGRITGMDTFTLIAKVETPLSTITDVEAREAVAKLPAATLDRLGLRAG